MNTIGPLTKTPYLSQFDERLDGEKHGRHCGIACLLMVLNYWSDSTDLPAPDVAEVKTYAETIGGLSDQGWTHTKLAETARAFGCSAVVRSWFRREVDITRMYEQKRLQTRVEQDEYQQQVADEFVGTLHRLLERSIPVILSVKPGFGQPMYGNGENNHLVVIIGADDECNSFWVHDPQCPPGGGEAVEISRQRLLEFCNYNAVIVFRG